MTDAVDLLLAAPRGRRLLAALIGGPHDPDRGPTPWHADSLLADLSARRTTTRAIASHLAAHVRTTDLSRLAVTDDPAELLTPLLAAVDSARYWQEPDADDDVLALPEVAEQLRPLAGAVLSCPAARWWSHPAALPRPSAGATTNQPHGAGVDGAQQHVQHHVQHLSEDPDLADAPDPAVLSSAEVTALLGRWREAVLAEEERAAAERPLEADAAYSGTWWSTPAMSGLLATTPELPSSPTQAEDHTPPVGVVLVEDSMGWPLTATRRVQLSGGLRVYEVDGPAAWTALVEAHPLRVTRSRRHDWYRASGWEGSWVIPDWASAAREWDGVHVSVLGYLTTAGRALSTSVAGEQGAAARGLAAGPARTLLAGWDPGTTWWLSSVAVGFGAPVHWRLGEGDQVLRWQADRPV